MHSRLNVRSGLMRLSESLDATCIARQRQAARQTKTSLSLADRAEFFPAFERGKQLLFDLGVAFAEFRR